MVPTAFLSGEEEHESNANRTETAFPWFRPSSPSSLKMRHRVEETTITYMPRNSHVRCCLRCETVPKATRAAGFTARRTQSECQSQFGLDVCRCTKASKEKRRASQWQPCPLLYAPHYLRVRTRLAVEPSLYPSLHTKHRCRQAKSGDATASPRPLPYHTLDSRILPYHRKSSINCCSHDNAAI